MSGTNLIEAIAAERVQQRAPDRWRRYADLLEKPTVTSAEIEEVKKLAQGLGRTLEDMQRDQTALRTMRRLEQLISGGSASEPAFQEAHQAASAFNEEMDAAIADLKKRYKALVTKTEEWGAIQHNARESCNEVTNLRRANPQLLAHLVPPDPNTLTLTPWHGFCADELEAQAAENAKRLKA